MSLNLTFVLAFHEATRSFLILSIFPQLLCLHAVLERIKSTNYSLYKERGTALAAISGILLKKVQITGDIVEGNWVKSFLIYISKNYICMYI